MILAALDLGTNTFTLLIVEKNGTNFRRLLKRKEGVGLGNGGINEGIISEDSQLRALNVLKQFRADCDKYQVEKIFAFGTSAFRDAKNGEEFVAQVEKATGISISIISGEEEAELTYRGVALTYDIVKPTLIMDIGGGSTEFILADQSGILRKQSLNIGISRIYQGIPTSDPLLAKDIANIENWLEEKVGDKLNDYRCKTLIGASGSFDSFYAMIQRKAYDLDGVCARFDNAELANALNWLMQSSEADRNAHPYILPIRRVMGPITAVKTRWVIRKLGIETVYTSPYAMKEGALSKLL